MTTSKKNLLLLGIGALLFLGGLWWYQAEAFPEEASPTRVRIGTTEYQLEIADTDAKRALGLGERERLCEHCGMLFVFSSFGRYGFWMKGMQFPLDIAWLDGDTVVRIEHRVPAESREVYMPDRPVNRVLELNAGALDAVKIGDVLVFLR